MTYSSTQREVRYRIAARQSGNTITSWHRQITLDGNGEVDIVTFEAHCSQLPGEPGCIVVWTPQLSPNGRLLEQYSCSNVNCASPGECVLEYSTDEEEWFEVTQNEPPETEDCFFRCRCSG